MKSSSVQRVAPLRAASTGDLRALLDSRKSHLDVKVRTVRELKRRGTDGVALVLQDTARYPQHTKVQRAIIDALMVLAKKGNAQAKRSLFEVGCKMNPNLDEHAQQAYAKLVENNELESLGAIAEQTGNERRREMAQCVLGFTRHPQAVEILGRILQHPEGNSDTINVLCALGATRRVSAIPFLTIRKKEHSPNGITVALADGLAGIRHPHALAALHAALLHEDEYMFGHIIDALGDSHRALSKDKRYRRAPLVQAAGLVLARAQRDEKNRIIEHPLVLHDLIARAATPAEYRRLKNTRTYNLLRRQIEDAHRAGRGK